MKLPCFASSTVHDMSTWQDKGACRQKNGVLRDPGQLRNREESLLQTSCPVVKRSACRRVDGLVPGRILREAIKTTYPFPDQLLLEGVDKALIYREVERFDWRLVNCQCRRQRRQLFEACGCVQSRDAVEEEDEEQRVDAASGGPMEAEPESEGENELADLDEFDGVKVSSRKFSAKEEKLAESWRSVPSSRKGRRGTRAESQTEGSSRIPAKKSYSPRRYRCLPQTGLIVSYATVYRLELADGRTGTEAVGGLLSSLKEARCRRFYVKKSITKVLSQTICSLNPSVCQRPQYKLGECMAHADGHSYRQVKLIQWQRVGCQCVRMKAVVTARRLCGCPPPRVHKRCLDGVRRLELHIVTWTLRKPKHGQQQQQKGLQSSAHLAQELKSFCQKASRYMQHSIRCPEVRASHSTCKDGKMRFVVTVYLLQKCQCKERTRHRIVRCQQTSSRLGDKKLQGQSDKKLSRGGVGRVGDVALPPEHSTGRKPLQLVLPVEIMLDCVDLLPTKHCTQLEAEPYRMCDQAGNVRQYLCRKTCRQCECKF
ncbi:unnamed protein product [Protopolystoma xenopodis]|uniref:Uncharacterized protein n=1 Tax=Protopolystoma xenopodis TaxID=117903 RepID=A0A448WA77_9PLAT|nr:unnamed protein product [Protopolystoma xenopodis]